MRFFDIPEIPHFAPLKKFFREIAKKVLTDVFESAINGSAKEVKTYQIRNDSKLDTASNPK